MNNSYLERKVKLNLQIGESKELFPPLKTKDNVVLAGHSPQSEPSKDFMLFKTEKSNNFLNKPQSTVQDHTEIKDAMEDGWTKLFHTSKQMEFLMNLSTNTQLEMENAKTSLQSSKIPDSPMCPPEVTVKCLLLLTFNHCQLPSMLLDINSNHIQKVFQIMTVPLIQIMEFYWQVMDPMQEKIIGLLKIHGDLVGENKVFSD